MVGAKSIMLEPDLLKSALEAGPDAVIISDHSDAIVFANRQVMALFGYEPEETVGAGVELLLPERLPPQHTIHRHDVLASPQARPMGPELQLHGRRKDGSEFPVEIRLSPIPEAGLTTVVIRDVTDRKRVEAELVSAREEAKRASLAKSRFLATASHDLRQPLQTISLLNGTLHRLVSDEQASAAIAQQQQAIDAMSRLLGGLLDISKLESGTIRPDITDFTVVTLFEQMRLEFASLAASKGLQLRIESCTECVHSDHSLVEQILRNLVSNAIKYTRQGCVWMRCLQESVRIRIEVLDTGIGIPADQMPYIYDEFYQVNGTTLAREGYGLGLSIVQRLVKLLGLELDARSEVGRGSVFSLLLPAAAKSVRSAGTVCGRTAVREAPLTRAHVLLVEDDPAVRGATRTLLAVEGYRVTAVASLREALQAAQQSEAIDLVIADYHLDGETGMQVIAALREALDKRVKAILLTGDTSSFIRDIPEDSQLRIASKPINADELIDLLTAFLSPERALTGSSDLP